MATNYEQLIEFVINGEDDKFRELFHEIVVQESRKIYESMMDEETFGGNEVEELVDEITGDEEGMAEGEGEEMEVEVGDDEMDMDAEMGGEEEMGGEADLEDKVMDLEAALDELKAEFDALMAGEEAEEEQFPGIHGDEAGEEEVEVGGEEEFMAESEEEEEEECEEEEEDLEESKSARAKTESEWIREYVEKIGDVYKQEPASGEGKEVGKGGTASVTAKSVVAGKNDMGGSAKNTAQGGANPEPKGPVKGKVGELVGKVQNTPGGDAGKTSFKSKAPAAKTAEAGADAKSPVAK